jgi:hypothetical protein
MPTRSSTKQNKLAGASANTEVAGPCSHFAPEETSLRQLPVEFKALLKVLAPSKGLCKGHHNWCLHIVVCILCNCAEHEPRCISGANR